MVEQRWSSGGKSNFCIQALRERVDRDQDSFVVASFNLLFRQLLPRLARVLGTITQLEVRQQGAERSRMLKTADRKRVMLRIKVEEIELLTLDCSESVNPTSQSCGFEIPNYCAWHIVFSASSPTRGTQLAYVGETPKSRSDSSVPTIPHLRSKTPLHQCHREHS